MKRLMVVFTAALAVAILPLAFGPSARGQQGSNCTPLTGQGMCLPSSVTADLATAPLDVQFSPSENFPSQPPSNQQFPKIQQDFDVFAWRSFVAANWPAATFDPNQSGSVTRGLPDKTQMIGAKGDNPTVWETYQPNYYLFAADANGNPAPPPGGNSGIQGWQQNAPPAAACGPSGSKVMVSISKAAGMPNSLSQAFSGPIISQNGYYAFYEVRLNFPYFAYVLNNSLYDANKQANVNPISFPAGSLPSAVTPAIAYKASWKVLTAAEQASGRFHTITSFLASGPPDTSQTSCAGPVTLGLVGLHLAIKSSNAPQWVWATFEQVDNAPNTKKPQPPPNGSGWSFNNPACTNCSPTNQMPNCPNGSGSCDWQPTSTHTNDATGGPTQITRDTPLPTKKILGGTPPSPAPATLNAYMQYLLKQVNPKSVWQYYQLIDTQWPTTPFSSGTTPNQCPLGGQQSFACTPAGPAPATLSNTTMETYFQAKSTSLPPAMGTCLGCHGQATTMSNAQVPADFSYELKEMAHPNPNPAGTLAAVTRNAKITARKAALTPKKK